MQEGQPLPLVALTQLWGRNCSLQPLRCRLCPYSAHASCPLGVGRQLCRSLKHGHLAFSPLPHTRPLR